MAKELTYKIKEKLSDGSTKEIAYVKVSIPDDDVTLYSDYEWDSKLGLVTALKNGKRVIVPHIGSNQTVTLDPTKEYETENIY